MGGAQRYVSDELTHFVGRGLPERAQYATLLRILRAGRLVPAPSEPIPRGLVAVRPDRPLSENEAIAPEAVCFCDIPAGDLGLHIAKYSPFGLAFPKTFLAARGASPVFYVARDGAVPATSAGGAAVRRGEAFDEMGLLYARLREAARLRDDPLARDLRRFAELLDLHVFGQLKFFRAPADEADPRNYYMEREWRLLGEVRFALDDVRRILLPEAYAARLRRDVPGYAAQVVFTTSGAG